MCALRPLDDSTVYKASGDITSRGDKSVLVADSRRLSRNVGQPWFVVTPRHPIGPERPISERRSAKQ